MEKTGIFSIYGGNLLCFRYKAFVNKLNNFFYIKKIIKPKGFYSTNKFSHENLALELCLKVLRKFSVKHV